MVINIHSLIVSTSVSTIGSWHCDDHRWWLTTRALTLAFCLQQCEHNTLFDFSLGLNH